MLRNIFCEFLHIAAEYRDIGLGRIVLILHSRRKHPFAVGNFFGNALCTKRIFLAHNTLYIFKGHKTGAEKPYLSVAVKGDNCGFNAYSTVTAVNDSRYPAVHILINVHCGSGAGTSRKIGGGSCKSAAASSDYLSCHGVNGKANANGIKPAACGHRNDVLFGQHHSERSRPERLCKLQCIFGNFGHIFIYVGKLADMYDKRIVLWSALCLEYFRNCTAVLCICGKSVNGLGRDSHYPALTEQLCRFVNIFIGR